MTEAARAPLTDPDCDLRAYRDMPFDIGRFQNSGLVTHESAESVVAAIHLWGAAWHQVPAASLPDNDKELAKMAGYGRAIDTWLAVREGALRGFVLCSDGRLYHGVLAEKANAAWESRLKHLWTKAGDRHRKAQKGVPENDRQPFIEFDAWLDLRRSGNLPPEFAPRSAGTQTEGQGTLPLEEAADSGAGSRAPARARVEANSDGNEDQFRRNDPSIPAENALKGREGKGIYIDRSTRAPGHVRARVHESEPPFDRSIDFPYSDSSPLETAEHLAEIAGLTLRSEKAKASAASEVAGWRSLGVDFGAIVEPAVREIIAASDDPTSSLHRFDREVRKRHARLKAKPRTNGAAPIAESVPMLSPEGEDPIFVTLREDLVRAIGPSTFALRFNAIRFADAVIGTPPNEKHALEVIGPSYATSMARDDTALQNVAKRHNFAKVI